MGLSDVEGYQKWGGGGFKDKSLKGRGFDVLSIGQRGAILEDDEGSQTALGFEAEVHFISA